MLCLLRPTDGKLLLDGIELNDKEVPAWQDCCSYVPQSITLLNSIIIQNIAYGVDEKIIDHERVWDALRAAQLADLVSEMPMGLHSSVGDNGIRLSGGQRQRLAIARAFYRQSKLLVLDEATSALDNRTEAEVMNAIEIIGRRCTIVTIAHRLSTIERSDCIYEFKNGQWRSASVLEPWSGIAYKSNSASRVFIQPNISGDDNNSFSRKVPVHSNALRDGEWYIDCLLYTSPSPRDS